MFGKEWVPAYTSTHLKLRLLGSSVRSDKVRADGKRALTGIGLEAAKTDFAFTALVMDDRLGKKGPTDEFRLWGEVRQIGQGIATAPDLQIFPKTLDSAGIIQVEAGRRSKAPAARLGSLQFANQNQIFVFPIPLVCLIGCKDVRKNTGLFARTREFA